ncbi:tripartite tricarboxylate transporter permease [Pelagibacterium sp. 26DY04]|uniref:tripartite tricarboxylate transporter permease n=1 Tax=Pelagibacterium sp. 26DY04 TaxID=2967130 RepID=UPI002815071A|nr:tripartite tricarboxylate transporter permease [Pelagibacterium sp. 26DY04]WMT88113.1 tripartite tricarboxylate transporter permease [Pelagibacterium sp. 26DY04]
METLDLLLQGLASALAFDNLIAVLIGVLLGLAVGALPALGPAAGVAILLPAIVNLDPTVAIAGLAGVYYGAMYGGAVTSILIGVPGDSSSMMTIVDGYPLAKKGQAGRALGMAVYASFVGGLISLVLMTFLSAPVARTALAFGPVEMTAIIVLALCLVTVLGEDDVFKGYLGLGFGLWIGMIGLDPVSGTPRFTFNNFHLLEGIDFTIVVVGMYGLGQIFAALGQGQGGKAETAAYTLKSLFPRFSDFLKCKWTLVTSSLIGFVVGILPGAGATAATIFSYAVAKRTSKTPEEFGSGAIEGVAAPEASNNAASYSAMIPLFTLGIPGSGTTAVMLGGLLMLGLEPGPRLFSQQPEFIWSLIGTFYIGNISLVFLTLALIPVLAALVFLKNAILFPIVIGVVFFGVYSVGYSVMDVVIAALFGLAGYVFTKARYPMLPILLGVILGPLLERAIRRSLIISQGDVGIFFSSAISVVVFGAAIVLFVYGVIWPAVKSAMGKRAQEA